MGWFSFLSKIKSAAPADAAKVRAAAAAVGGPRGGMKALCPQCDHVVDIPRGVVGESVVCRGCQGAIPIPAGRVAPGVVIGGVYLVERELAKGGMGTVYLAAELGTRRPVALKILHRHFSEDKTFIAEFFREANAVAQINHPGIVQAYAVGEEDGLYYFAMEYVHGQTLKELMADEGRLTPERALDIVRDVNVSLSYAWSTHRLIHRDVKPDNIMLTASGLVILADLGLARKATDVLQVHSGDEVAGTPQYMSPEQILLQSLDCRSDIYSLGATLYHALTGQFPYPGKTLAQVAMQHLTEPLVAPARLVSSIPEPLSQLVAVMMAKRQEHRYATGDALADDIDRVARGQMPLYPLPADSQAPLDLSSVSGIDEATEREVGALRSTLRLDVPTLSLKPGASVTLRHAGAIKLTLPAQLEVSAK